MGKLAKLAETHGIQNLNEKQLRKSIRDGLANHEIPAAPMRRQHYKAEGDPARSKMDDLTDRIKMTLPLQFAGIPNHVFNSLVKLVVTSDESDARAAVRKAEKKELEFHEQELRTATAGVVFDDTVEGKAMNKEIGGLRKDLAAFDLESTKRIKAIQEEREMELLLEARARRALATLELAKKVKSMNITAPADTIDAPPPPPPAAPLPLPPTVCVTRKHRKALPSREATGLPSLAQAPVRPLESIVKKRNRVVFAEGTKRA